MKTGIIAFAIAVMLLMLTVQTVAAIPFTAVGNVEFEDGTAVPYGWTVEIWNLDQEFGAEPWDDITKWVPPVPYEYGITCEYELETDYIHVRVTSTDGTYVGENISRWDEVFIGPSAKTCMDVIVYEVQQETENHTQPMLADWNLISLPLTPIDNNVSAVLSGVSDVVYRYNPTSKEFECPSTMDVGIGYFVHVTTPSTWEYEGTPVTSTSSGLESGLNMIGVPNCTMSITDAMGSADYRYVARWNVADQKFEVYNPSAPSEFHGFSMMTAGEGYFVSAKSDDGAFAISCPG